MKTILFTLSALAMLITSKFESNLNSNLESNLLETTIELSSTSSYTIVNATKYKGEIIPVVQLLTLDIFGSNQKGTKVLTTEYKGERIPTVTLPELNIIDRLSCLAFGWPEYSAFLTRPVKSDTKRCASLFGSSL